MIGYDDNTYKLSLVNWPVIWLPKDIFEEFEQLIISDPEGDNAKKKLTITKGKRRYCGKLAIIRYYYGSAYGSFHVTSNMISGRALSYLLKHTNMNETEERIWILDDNQTFIRINGCITGYIEPKGDDSIEQAIDSGLLLPEKVLNY